MKIELFHRKDNIFAFQVFDENNVVQDTYTLPDYKSILNSKDYSIHIVDFNKQANSKKNMEAFILTVLNAGPYTRIANDSFKN